MSGLRALGLPEQAARVAEEASSFFRETLPFEDYHPDPGQFSTGPSGS